VSGGGAGADGGSAFEAKRHYNRRTMSTVETPSKPAGPKHEHFDPEEFRMSLGDHLEELRTRILLGMAGFVVAGIVCLIYGKKVLILFCLPLTNGFKKYGLPDTIVTSKITDAFTTYMSVSLIVAAAIAGPWMLYQLWQFIAAGLYPKERKYVTKYMPFSICLLISGMLFLYFVVLPITVNFLLFFSLEIKLHDTPKVASTQPTFVIPELAGDPEKPQEHQIWYDSTEDRAKIFIHGRIRSFMMGGENLITPMITLPEYIDLVIILLLMFGLAFQMPLVVMAVAKVGIVDIPTLKKFRRFVYFGMAILSAIIVPDVVTGMLALMFPLILLYEFGIILAARSIKAAEAAARAEGL
jgi:Tat protein translocase TatC